MSSIISAYTIDLCKDSLGGLKIVRLTSFNDVEYVEDLGDIVNIGLKPDKVFYTFQLVKNLSSFSITPNKEKATGLLSYDENLNLAFNRLKKENSDILIKLTKTSVMAIAEDRNGGYILLGRYTGLFVNSSSINSGVSMGDRNGYEVKFSSKSKSISHVDPQFMNDSFNPGGYTRIFENTFASQFE